MTNFLKSLIPNILLIIGFGFDELAKIFAKSGFKIHESLNTEIGQKLKKMRKETEQLETFMKNLENKELKKAPASSDKAAARKKAQKALGKINPKLYNIIKGDSSDS